MPQFRSDFTGSDFTLRDWSPWSLRRIQVALQSRGGGEQEVATPVGFVDLVTDDHVIEIKHVSDWKDGIKVLVYALYLSNRKPRLHLFGGYSKDFRSLVEQALEPLKIAVT